jgi:hypothetical protein
MFRSATAMCVGLLVFTATTHAQLASIGLNFTGISYNGWIPPDTMGTVGPNHIIEMLNGTYRVYDKATGAQLESRSLNSFWSTYGQGYAGYSFDPRVQYDPGSQRFYAHSVDNAGNPNNFLFAVSKTSNPLDGWDGWKIDADTDNVQWADFGQMGFNKDAVVITANMFAVSTGSFSSNMLVLPKADLLAATPTVANATLLEDQRSNVSFDSSLQPAIDLDGTRSELQTFSGSNSFIGINSFTGLTGTPSVSHDKDLSVTYYNSPPLAEQPGTQTVNLDSGGNRVRSAVTLIDDHYYGVQGVDVSGRAALRWFKIDADTNNLVAEGTITDPVKDLIYGSIAANEYGDIVIGMTGTSNDEYASAYAVVGDTDEFGNITFGNLLLLKAGLGEYDRTSNGRNRWGDYSATVLDPSDPFTFWTFQEWASTGNNWSTQITEITVVPEPATLALMGIGAIMMVRRRRAA